MTFTNMIKLIQRACVQRDFAVTLRYEVFFSLSIWSRKTFYSCWVIRTTDLQQWPCTVYMSIEDASVQSCPSRLFVFCRQIHSICFCQPIQYTFLTTGRSKVECTPAKRILACCCIVAVRSKKGLDLAFTSSGHYRNNIQSMLQWSTFQGAVRHQRTHLPLFSSARPP